MRSTNFSADFGVFAIFDRNFAKIVAPPGDENGQSLVHLNMLCVKMIEILLSVTVLLSYYTGRFSSF